MTAVSHEERVLRARSAQAEWSKLSVSDRVHAMQKLRLVIAAQRQRLVDAIVRETGKPPLDALSGDVMVLLEQMRYYECHAARILRSRRVGQPAWFYRGAKFHEHYQPHGVALIFGPSNYPLQLSMVPAITALYAGNAVLLKCSERTPATAQLIDEICRAAQLPANLIQVFCDAPDSAAALIDAHPDIVFFTGSSANGRAVAERAARLLVPVVLELGGKDVAIVFDDCDLERTVEGVAYGAFANAGQVCVGIKRLYLQDGIYGEFIQRLTARMVNLRVGTTYDCDVGLLRDERTQQRLHAQVEDAVSRGATVVHRISDEFLGTKAIILSDVHRQSRLLREESFGPVLCVERFAEEGDAISLANDSPFALGSSVWTRDLARAQRVAMAINTGTCAINDVLRNVGNPHAAFGGNNASGFGRYHGAAGLMTFSRVKTVMTVARGRKHEINWFPFTHKAYRGLDTILELMHRPHGLARAIRRLLAIGLLTLPCFESLRFNGSGVKMVRPEQEIAIALVRAA